MSFFYKLLEKFAQMLVPTGAILPFIGTEVPEGFILWQEYKIYESQLPKLYARYSTVENFTKGSDSSGNYVQLPSINDRTLQACSSFSLVGKLLEAALPNITGALTAYKYTEYDGAAGAFYRSTSVETTNYVTVHPGTTSYPVNLFLDASRLSSTYSSSAGLQVPSVQTLMIIKA